MSEFFKLHQRQDLILFDQGSGPVIGVILGYNENNYAVKTLFGPKDPIQAAFLDVEEDQVTQKVGQLDFDSLAEAEEGFEFGDWVEIEEF